MFANLVDVRRLFELAILVDAFLDENLLQRLEMELLQQLTLPDLQFLSNQVFCSLHRMYQHIG